MLGGPAVSKALAVEVAFSELEVALALEAYPLAVSLPHPKLAAGAIVGV